VHFTDGKSLVSKFQIKATTGAGFTGTLALDWTDNVTGINSATYTGDWQLVTGVWDLLLPGTNYISIRTYDNVVNYTDDSDVFVIKKDTTAPEITNNQSGDNTWLKLNAGAIYDVEFDDNGSLIDTIEYSVWSEAFPDGDNLIPWTVISSGPLNSASFSELWGVSDSSWTLLNEGQNYVSVRVWDIAGTTIMVPGIALGKMPRERFIMLIFMIPAVLLLKA
jgi:hypothetical protein